MKKILLVLLLPIIKLSEKEGIKINNIDTDYLKVTIFNNCDYELSIKNQYDYKYIIYKNINDIDTLQENTFYIFIMYTNNKPSSRFISISNNYNELYSLKKDNNSFLLKKNENITLTFPIQKYKEADFYKNYYNSKTKFFNYLLLPKKSVYKINIIYKYKKEGNSKILSSNHIYLKT